MAVLVTGANGFVGSHLVQTLVSKGYQVKALVRRTSDLKWLKDLPIDYVYGDVKEPGSLKEAVKEVETVFHLAGLVKAKRPEDFYSVNHEGTKSLLTACESEGKEVKRFIYVSSMAAAGPSFNGRPRKESDPPSPINDYGRSKMLAEQEAQSRTDRFLVGIARPAAVYGPRDWEVYPFYRLVSRGMVVKPAGADPFISVVYVKDLVEGLRLMGEKDYPSGSIFFFSDGKNRRWSELGNVIGGIIGVRPKIVAVPTPAMKFIGLISELWAKASGKAAMLTRQKIKEMLVPWWCDSSSASAVLGYSPVYDFETGSRETIDWYRSLKRL